MHFIVAFENVLLTLIYLLPGYILCKMGKAKENHLSTLSAILVYALGPCMIISSFLKLEFSWEVFAKMGLFFVVTLVLQIIVMGGLYLIFKKKYEESKYRLLTIGSVLGNVGFFGLPIIQALIPDNPIVMCYSSIYVVSMNLLVFTMGSFCLTNDSKYMSVKQAFINPSFFALVIAIPLFIFNAKEYLPQLVLHPLDLLGKMTTPICMFILGIRLATMSLKKIFCNWHVYIIVLSKLVLFPLFCYFCVYFIPFFDSTFKVSILILASTPCASVILNFAEMYHSEEEMAANCVLLSTLLCCLTIPLLTLLG